MTHIYVDRRGVFLLWQTLSYQEKYNIKTEGDEKMEEKGREWTGSVTLDIRTYLAELRVDIMLPPTCPLTPPLTEEGLTDVGERCGVFLLTGDLVECFGKILAWFASLLGQPDKLSKKNPGNHC